MEVYMEPATGSPSAFAQGDQPEPIFKNEQMKVSFQDPILEKSIKGRKELSKKISQAYQHWENDLEKDIPVLHLHLYKNQPGSRKVVFIKVNDTGEASWVGKIQKLWYTYWPFITNRLIVEYKKIGESDAEFYPFTPEQKKSLNALADTIQFPLKGGNWEDVYRTLEPDTTKILPLRSMDRSVPVQQYVFSKILVKALRYHQEHTDSNIGLLICFMRDQGPQLDSTNPTLMRLLENASFG